LECFVTKTLQIDYTRHSIGDKRLLTMAAMVLVYACAWFAATGVGLATAEAGIASSPDKAAPLVQICRRENQFYLYRGDELYYVKGVGGDRYLESAAAAGANSVRTWGSQDATAVLDHAHSLNMTVMLGIWMSHEADSYLSADYKRGKIAEVKAVLEQCKDHPALLMWAVGNEINLEGADTPEAWNFINELAQLIKSYDPDHPVISVVSFSDKVFDNIARYAPDLDAVGINAYGSLPKLRTTIERSAYSGPYLVTEWGTNGHWEVDQTSWGSPIEPTSAEKAALFQSRYEHDILANRDRCLGSYVFVWGEKQERTPTWYSMFIEEIPGVPLKKVSCPQVDVMGYSWTGLWPSNRAPEVTALTINGRAADGGVNLAAGQQLVAAVSAHDPDEDHLTYIWELLKKPELLGTGGGYEPRPERIGGVSHGTRPWLDLSAPETTGAYRLFVYVLDENGHVGTANIPFQVTSYQAHEGIATPPTSTPEG
jgi:hypothetical protein